ncbi:MAG: glutamate--tRNA ligase family protein, partial [Myxococcota bacterium]
MSTEPETGSKNFIRAIVADDLASEKHARIITRWPPEPSGYIHIGHATAISLNFGIAAENAGGVCHLRFDDTNPVNEEVEYVDSIQSDIRWLGYDWKDYLYFTSDYFPQLYAFAMQLIEKGLAFVCDLSSEEIAARRGTLTEAGTPSP